MTDFRAVIFDLDGTLIDSNDAHTRAWVRAFEDEGLTVSLQQVRALVGMGGDQLVPRVSGVQPKTPAYERLSKAWLRHFQAEELPGLRAQPGARQLLLALRDRGLRLIAGTSAEESLVDALLKVADAQDLLTQHTSASEVAASKPAPDIVQAALGKLGLPPEQVLMVGDTVFDVQSAAQAGVKTIFLRCGGNPPEGGPLAVYDSPQHLLDELERSPLG